MYIPSSNICDYNIRELPGGRLKDRKHMDKTKNNRSGCHWKISIIKMGLGKTCGQGSGK